MKNYLINLFRNPDLKVWVILLSLSTYIIYLATLLAVVYLFSGCRNNEQVVKDYIKEHTSIDSPIYVTDTLISKEYKLDTMFIVSKDTIRYVIQKDKVVTTFYKQYDTIRIKSRCIPDTVIKTNQIIQLKETGTHKSDNLMLYIYAGVITVCALFFLSRR